jgi:multidrug efflux pump subunit AcrA (membrane-fusion protein)
MSVSRRPTSAVRQGPSTRGSWYLYGLALLGVALLVAAILEIGPASSSSRTSREVVTAERGIVQSTVSASGNIAAGTDVEANFATSGTLSQVYVHVGQHVSQGQLLATLDPTADELSVDQARASLLAAQDQLTEVENGTATGSSGSGGSSNGSNASSSNADTAPATGTEFVSQDEIGAARSRSTTTVRTSTVRTKSSGGSKSTSGSGSSGSASRSGSRSSKGSSATSAGSGSATSRGSSTRTSTTTKTTAPAPSAIASAQASVDGAELNLHNAEDTLASTRLYSPAAGTIVSLASLSPGDQVSASSASNSGSSNSSGSSSGGGTSSRSGTSSGASTSGSGSSASAAGSLGSSSSSSSSSTGFAEIVNTNRLTMTVPFSESDISKIQVGQSATVTLDALSGVELAAHVASISPLGTTSSSVVSYDATLDLDQTNPQVRAGMSAAATVITKQASGVTLPTSAVSGTGSTSTLRVLKHGQTVSTPVVVGLRGTSRTQIVSGISPGTQVVVITTLPPLGTGSSSSFGSTSGTSRFGGAGGVGGFGGGGGFGGLRRSGGFGGGAP